MPRIRNFHVTVKELAHTVVFLRKLVQGGSEHSFGIHVAKMAGIPSKVVHRAQEMLKHLEASRSEPGSTKKISSPSDLQLSFFKLDDPVLEQIREEIVNIDIDNLTPMQALTKLNEIRKLVGGK
jgi:DNA mismatch repair protein MutS